MDEPRTEGMLEKQVRALQMTIGALIAGALILAGVAIVLRQRGFQANFGAVPIVSIVAVLQAVGSLTARPLVLNASLRSARQKIALSGADSDAAWAPVFASRTILGAALLEGAAFLFFIAYLLEGQWWALAGGLAMVGLMAVWHFPNQNKVEQWIAEQREAVKMAE
jgi:uncharacterized membrane protein YraQ (UPF0718 family)